MSKKLLVTLLLVCILMTSVMTVTAFANEDEACAHNWVADTNTSDNVDSVCNLCGSVVRNSRNNFTTGTRVSYSADEAVWNENGITVTVEKGTAATVTDYHKDNRNRIAAGSVMTIKLDNGDPITKVVWRMPNHTTTSNGFYKGVDHYKTAYSKIQTNVACTITWSLDTSASAAPAYVTFELLEPAAEFSFTALTGNTYFDYVDVYGVHKHEYEVEATPSTCTEAGSNVYTCDKCGESYTEIIPAHNWVETDDGVVCSGCGLVKLSGLVYGHESARTELADEYALYSANGVSFEVALNGSANALTTGKSPMIILKDQKLTISAANGDITKIVWNMPGYQEAIDAGTSNNYTKALTALKAAAKDGTLFGDYAVASYSFETTFRESDGAYSGTNLTIEFATPVDSFVFVANNRYYISELTVEYAHEHSYEAAVTAPDCVNGGFTTYTCACGDSYTANATEALGHTTVDVAGKDATCTEDGYTASSYCSVCGETIVAAEAISANGHAWVDATYEAPKTCTACGATEGEALKPAGVVEVNGVKYASLQDAIDAANDGDVIVILANIELSAQDAQQYFKPAYNRESYAGIIIPDDKILTIDLQGNTISYVDTYGNIDNVMILNLGNLTVNDSVGGGVITYKAVADTSTYSKFYSTIFNCGTLTVNAGRIENTMDTETDVSNAIDNHSRLSHEYGNDSILVVNGGEIVGAYYYAIRQYTHYSEGVLNRVTINGGTIYGGIYMQHGESWYYPNPDAKRLNVDLQLVINGGLITKDLTPDDWGKVRARLSNPDNAAFKIEINGGVFEVPVELQIQRGVYYTNGVSGATTPAEATGARNAEWLAKNGGFIKGGKFLELGVAGGNTDILAFLAEGYALDAEGNVIEAPVVVGPAVNIKYTNVAIAESFKLSFAFALDSVEIWDGYYVVLTKTSANDGSVDTIVIPKDEWTVTTIDGAQYLVVGYAGVAAKEMGDVISIVVYDAEGVAASDEKVDSIKDYAMRLLADAKGAELITLVVDMLNYGAEAQKYFGYATDALANADLTEDQQAYASEAREYSDEAYTKVYSDGYAFSAGHTLSLEYNVQLKLGMDLRALELGEDAKIVVSYVDFRGNTVVKTVDVECYKTGIVYVTCDTLTAMDRESQVKFELVDGEDVIFTFANSVEGYTARLDAESNESDICGALMKYCDSAAAYFAKI